MMETGASPEKMCNSMKGSLIKKQVWTQIFFHLCYVVMDQNPILYFWPNHNQKRNAVIETESKPKVNGK